MFFFILHVNLVSSPIRFVLVADSLESHNRILGQQLKLLFEFRTHSNNDSNSSLIELCTNYFEISFD